MLILRLTLSLLNVARQSIRTQTKYMTFVTGARGGKTHLSKLLLGLVLLLTG